MFKNIQYNTVNIINGINTNVGKTFFTCNSIKQLKKKSKKINAIKPIISGFEENSDTELLLKANEKPINDENFKKTTKYFLKLPLSPNIAAKIENIELNYTAILEFCFQNIENAIKNDEVLFIEMAGGICSPITEHRTMLDLTKDISSTFSVCKNFLITSNYLGAISHTISACKLFNFDEIIFNIFEKSEYDDEILQTIKNFTEVKISKNWCP